MFSAAAEIFNGFFAAFTHLSKSLSLIITLEYVNILAIDIQSWTNCTLDADRAHLGAHSFLGTPDFLGADMVFARSLFYAGCFAKQLTKVGSL